MKARAESTAGNNRKIIEVTADLWTKHSLHEITLEDVAAAAGVTVRTILRKYGSKEGLFEACIESDGANMELNRNRVEEGDVEAALNVLMEDYEKYGDANIRTLTLEDSVPVAGKLLENGRKFHKQWCARVFAPFLPSPSHAMYNRRLHAFYAATEVYLWKLLRRDLHHSRVETENIFRELINGLVMGNKSQ